MEAPSVKTQGVNVEHLSYSSIALYQTCPAAWRFRYVDKVQTAPAPALVFGSAFHGAIEYMLRRKVEGRKIDGPSTWEAAWDHALADAEQAAHLAGAEITWDNGGPERLYQDGLTMLGHPGTAAFLADCEPLVVNGQLKMEERVDLHVPGVPVPIIGYIDLLDREGIPTDFKTAGRAWTEEQAQKETQPGFYLAALNQAGFSLNKELAFRHVVFVKPGKAGTVKVQTFTTRRTYADLFRLFSTIVAVWKGIEAGAFPCNTQSWRCSPRFCDHWAQCQGKV